MMLRAALGYVRRMNWKVFPLRIRGKEPNGKLAPNGVHDATLNEITIREWWKAYPDANVGLPCGQGFFVLDVDPRNNGDETLGALEREHGKLPQTPCAVTGSGGRHILFALVDGVKLKGSLGEGLDVKGIGGYVVAAPSIHPCGGAYTWEASAHPLEVPIAEAPEWMTRSLCKRAIAPSASVGAAAESFLARCFDVAGWLGAAQDSARVMARCPWSNEHSADRQGNRTGEGQDTSCVILAPTGDRPLGIFHCAHGHCSHRGNLDALRALPIAAVACVARSMPEHFDLATGIIARRSR